MLTFNHCVDSTTQEAIFGVTDVTSLIANGVLTLRGSFWQEIFNASGKVTIEGPGGLPSAQQYHFRPSKLPPPSPGPLLAKKCGPGGPVLAWTTFHMTKLLPHFL